MKCDTCTAAKTLAKCEECERGGYSAYERGAVPLSAKKSDMVNHPNHYTQGGIECIDAIEAAVTGLTGMDAVCTAQVIRYIWRWKHKNGLEDLKKTRWYLDKLIKYHEGNG